MKLSAMIAPAQGRACRTRMRYIAARRAPTDSIENERARDALTAIGWMDRPEDYFDYTDGCEHCGHTYEPGQVLMALAFCVTLSDENAAGGE